MKTNNHRAKASKTDTPTFIMDGLNPKQTKEYFTELERQIRLNGGEYCDNRAHIFTPIKRKGVKND